MLAAGYTLGENARKVQDAERELQKRVKEFEKCSNKLSTELNFLQRKFLEEKSGGGYQLKGYSLFRSKKNFR